MKKYVLKLLRTIIGVQRYKKFKNLYIINRPKIKNKKKKIYLFGFNNEKIKKYIENYLGDNCEIIYMEKTRVEKSILIGIQKYRNIEFYISKKSSNQYILNFALEYNIPVYLVQESAINPAEYVSTVIKEVSLEVKDLSNKGSNWIELLNSVDVKNDSNLFNEAVALLKELQVLEGDLTLTNKKKNQKRILVIGESKFELMVNNSESCKKMTNSDMLMMAKIENPGAEIYYLPYDSQNSSEPSDYNLISQESILLEKNQHKIFKGIDVVYTFSSDLGLRAILNDIKVVTFGSPFYAGWGLTEDRITFEDRERVLVKEELIGFYLQKFAKYYHPFSNEEINLRMLIKLFNSFGHTGIIEDSNEEETNKGHVFLLGFDTEKIDIVRNFFPAYTNIIMIEKNQGIGKFRKMLENSPNGKVYIWTGDNQEDSVGLDNTEKLIDIVLEKEYTRYYTSIGIIDYYVYNRHNMSPFSLVFDKKDIPYSNNNQNSLLYMLNSNKYKEDSELLTRSKLLIEQIKGNNKGNSNDATESLIISEKNEQEKVLVIGVPKAIGKDNGVGDNMSSLDLVWIAKLENPESQVMYIEDPTINSPNIEMENIGKLADVIDSDKDILELLWSVDKIYTKDSIIAFYGLILSKQVITFGAPFYAGWGVTIDRNPIANRSQRLTLEALVGVSLIEYPKYINPYTKEMIDVESAVELQSKVTKIAKKAGLSYKRNKPIFNTENDKIDSFHLETQLIGKKVAIISPGLKKMPNLDKLLPADIIYDPTGNQIEELDYVGGWGLKPGYKDARVFAEKHSIPYLAMEDGFLRSIGLGVDGSPALSFSLDDIGVYYDATRPSRMENILNSTGWETPELMEDAKRAMNLIKTNYLSKYNVGEILKEENFRQNGKKRILVVDQTFGDMSISLGLGNQQSFINMYNKAKEENPEADFYLKVHPDVIAGKKQGNITDIKEDENTILLTEDSNPLSLIEHMDKVYCVTSQMGFEALIMGKEVRCFGMPFYAGWGVTNDEIILDRRKKVRTVEELFAASYIIYCTYLNPSTGKTGNIFDVIDYIVETKNKGTVMR